FARWIEHVLGRHGLVVYDASDPSAKSLVQDVFTRELSTAGQTARLATAAGADLAARGYHTQVQLQDDGPALFRFEGGRRLIRQRDGHFFIGDEQYAAAALVDEAAKAPAGFSPNVLLRPIVQDS